jgi:uncharacterized protein involved in outer membrane biogenesis
VAYPAQVDRPNPVAAVKDRTHEILERIRARRAERRPENDAEAPRKSHRGLAVTGAVIGAVVVAILMFLAWFDWDYLRGPVARYASGRIGRPVAIDGHLQVQLLSWTPSATVEGLRVANPPGRSGDMTAIRKLSVAVQLRPLFRGKVILPLVQADQPNIDLFRDAQGRNNWTFKGKSPGEPTRLPAIRRFEINDGHVRIEDQTRHLTFVGTVSSSEVVGAQTVQGFRLRGDGRLNTEPFTMNLTGGPLINVDPDRPYPFDADVHAGATHVLAKGSITKPFDLGLFRTSLQVTGPDMADLFPLTGLTLPNTPPYTVSGTLARNDRIYRYEGLNGRVGDSDLHGWMAVKTGLKRPMLTGDVRSNMLSMKDLSAVIGGGSTNAKAGPIKASQVQVAQKMRAAQRLFPDTELNVDRLRKMDADVKYRATSIRGGVIPVKSGSVHVLLDNGLLKLDDLTFALPQGQMAGQVAINARQAIPAVDLDMKMTGARLEQFLPVRFKTGAVGGSLVARARLHGTGKSLHQAASTASGTVAAVVPHGEIREAFAELMGVDVTKGLGLLLAKNQD